MGPTEWDERYRSAGRLWPAEPNLFVQDRLTDRPPGRGLDLAAGEGRNAVWLASRGWTMTAVDFSEVATGRGAGQHPLVEFIVANVLEWEPSTSFDLILIAYLHLVSTDLEKVVRRSIDWLEPGGELFLVGHDRSNLESGYGGPQDPELLWDLSQILGWLDGLLIVEAEVVRRPVDTEEGARFARDVLVRARVSPRARPS